MSKSLSPNTQAILLLTAPLMTAPGQSNPAILTPGEYKRLARRLRELQRQPADLLSTDAPALLQECHAEVDAERAARLLGRGFQLSQAVERWQARAIWVVSRADPDYPARLKARLKEDAPPILYGCGEGRLLETGGLAIVGSRDVDETLIAFTRRVSELAAQAGATVVSGGARGIDQAAMRGALEAGGIVVGVLADSLERAVLQREHREMLMDGRLALVSPYDPGAGFNVGNAMQRNKLIYALADAALVAQSDYQKGGTWAGAVEQLEKFKFAPVYARATGDVSKGIAALLKKGALPWPEPATPDALLAILSGDGPAQGAAQTALQDELSFDTPVEPVVVRETVAPKAEYQPAAAQQPARAELDRADALYGTVRRLLLSLLQTPKKDVEVAASLNITIGQARQWLKCLVREGDVEKLSRPVRYVARGAGLFDASTPSDAS